MRKISIFILMTVFTVITGSFSAQVFSPTDASKEAKPLEIFQGDLSGFQVSPSGKGVAFLRYEDNRWALYWDNINGGRETRVSKKEEPNVVDFRWVGDDAIVYTTGDGPIGTELHRFETFTKAFNRLTSTPVWIKFLDSHYYSGGTTLLIADKGDLTTTKAYSIMPGMRELNHIASGYGVNWVEGFGNGATYYIQETDEGSQFIHCSLKDGSKLGSFKGLCSMKALAMASKSENLIYALSDLNRNNNALVKVNMADGSETEVIYERSGCMITKVLFSSLDSKPLVVWYDGLEKGYQVLDKAFEGTVSAMTEKLPTLMGFDIVHSDLSGNVWILSVVNPGGGKSYYHYNLPNLELKGFSNAVVAAEIVPVKELLPVGSDNLLVRYYVPSEVTPKSIGVLVFRNSPWASTCAGGMDALIQGLVQDGLMVAEIDLAYSEISRKKLLFAGYDQLVDRVLDQIPVIQKMMISNYGLTQNMISVLGEGIGCRAALRVTAAHTSIVLRSVFIDATPELKGCLATQFPIEMMTKDYIMGYGDAGQTLTLPYVAREPLFVYSGNKSIYFSGGIEPALQKLSQNGKSPESYMVGSGFGHHFSSGVIKGLSGKLVNYLRN
jgi:hypothetical protein